MPVTAYMLESHSMNLGKHILTRIIDPDRDAVHVPYSFVNVKPHSMLAPLEVNLVKKLVYI